MRAWTDLAGWLTSTLATGALLALAATAPARGASSEVQDESALRVCADPANLPYSNEKGEGFENKIAEMFAKDLGRPVAYTFVPQVIGFVRNTLRARNCDVVIGTVAGDDLVLNTNPYYRSSYVMMYRADGSISAKDLDDPQLKSKRIGAVARTPPIDLLLRHGLIDQLQHYHLMVDTRHEQPARTLVHDIATGGVDVGLLWGPIAGYFAKQEQVRLVMVPLGNEPDMPRMDYRITMGIRPDEVDWKHRIEQFLRDHRQDIQTLLLSYGIPLLDEQGHLIGP